ncbi:MAG TPA: response regulator, partial [Nannocystaceae bacterium]|nr:response regulator [Nannocystaceae bacterium]
MSAAPRKVSVHVLVVVDELILQSEIERRLSQDGHRAATVGSVREAIERLRREPFDTVLCDLHASPGDGAELLQWLGSYYPSIPVVVITAAVSPEARARSDGGSVRIIEKPVDLDRLVRMISEIGPRRGFFSNAIEIEFFDYVQMIAITGRDKAVMVTTREGVGSIWFEHGDISHVQFKEWRGEQGFYKLLAVGQGTFRETLFRAPPARTVMRSSTHLLMEAARLMDEGLLGADDVPPPPPLEPEPDDEE